MDAEQLTLLVAPELSFEELADQLVLRGHRLVSQSTEPLVPGEPEWAVFENDADCRIHYTYNPVATFRMLRLGGETALSTFADLAQSLPLVDWTRARSFLASSNPRDQWLGVLAAERLGDTRLRSSVEALVTGGEPRIASAAREALAALPEDSVAADVRSALESLVSEQRRRPDRNVLFAHLPGVELKRQVLRALGQDGGPSRAGTERVLRAALTDDDPEVRVTAMLVAARLRHVALGPAVREAAVPTDTASGAPPGDRLYFAKLQRLSERSLTGGGSAMSGGPAARRREVLETALRGEQPVLDDETLLWHALVTPLDLGGRPTRLPPGVVEDDEGYALTVPDGRIELCWVGAVSHWLGGLDASGASVPVRAVTPAPFFISAAPLAAPTPPHAGRWAGPFAAATRTVRTLAEATALPLRVPTADEWEMAARGPDGRFYPWGVGVRPGWRLEVSPWGVGGWGGGPEWAVDPGSGEPMVVGAADRPVPAATRRRPAPGETAGVRLVLPG